MLLTQNNNLILRPFALLIGKLLEGIFWVLDRFMEYPSAGLAIIIMTIVIYVLMLPLTIRQQKFSKLSAKMNPELTQIRKKYEGRNDQDSMMKMQAETQLVYQKYGVKPSGSCIQLLIQMPILYALYRVIYTMPAYVARIKDAFYPLVGDIVKGSTGEELTEFFKGFSGFSYYSKEFSNGLFGTETAEGIQHTENAVIDVLNRASTTEWTQVAEKFPDLADKVLSTSEELARFNNFFGMNIGLTPKFVIGTQLGVDNKNWMLILGAIAIPLLSAFTQWLNVKLTVQPQPETSGEENPMMSSMKTMNTLMPLMSAFFCYTLPIGMGIYWISGAVVRGVIQIVVNKHLDKMDIDSMIKENIEKMNEKRRKNGLPPEQIAANAKMSTKNAGNKKEENTAAKKAKIDKNIKDSTEYYNKNVSKPGSLASKAAMVKMYNEKNNNKE